MKNRRKKLDKNLVISIFLTAFDRAGIEREELVLKTPKPYEILAKEIIEENALDPADFLNYDKYIKDRYNALRRLLKDSSKNSISFNSLHFDPLKSYANAAYSPTHLAHVLYRLKKFSYFNFWRMPKPGTIIQRGKNLVLSTEHENQIDLGQDIRLETHSMPRDKRAQWLKLSYGNPTNNHIYIMPNLFQDQPASLSMLEGQIKKHLNTFS